MGILKSLIQKTNKVKLIRNYSASLKEEMIELYIKDDTKASLFPKLPLGKRSLHLFSK